MSSRTWQMLAAVVSIVLMVAVIFKYGLGDDAAKPTSGEPHVGAKHHTAEKPGEGAKPAHEGGKLSPIQVYEHAKVGDWRAYRVISEWSNKPVGKATVVARITEVTDTQVKRSLKGRLDGSPDARDDRGDERPRQGLTIDQLTGNDVGGWTIYDLTISDDTRTIDGRTFKCKKLSYASDDPLIPSKRTRTELWISAEAPAGGIVEERELQDMPTMTFVQTTTLIGLGDERTTWGTKPEGL